MRKNFRFKCFYCDKFLKVEDHEAAMNHIKACLEIYKLERENEKYLKRR